MKRIFAIFSVIFCLGAVVPNEGWGAVSCPNTLGTDAGDADHDLVIGRPLNSNSPRYWCQPSDGCRKSTYVALVGVFHVNAGDDPAVNTGGLNYKDSRVCDNLGANYLWRDPADTGSFSNLSISWCPGGGEHDFPRAEFVALNSDGEILRTGVCDANKTGCAVEVTDATCITWKCKSGFTWDSSQRKCVSQTEQQDEENCTNSGGDRWTGSECVCSDGNGLTQSSDKKTCVCKTAGGYQWVRNPNDAKKCIDPGEACSASNGHWTGAECDCSDLGAGYTTSADGAQCIQDQFFQPCQDSGGQWNGTECTNCDSGRGLEPAPDNKTCKCIDNDKEYSQGAGQCVSTDQANCENTGGEWDDTNETCACDSGKNIKQNPNNTKVCVCKNSDYGPNPTVDGCELTSDAEQRRDSFNELKDMCENDWGSSWYPGHWEWELSDGTDNPNGRDPSTWKCECSGTGVIQAGDNKSCQCDSQNGYLLQSTNPPYRCEQTDCAALQQKCNISTPGGGAVYHTKGIIHGREACYCECKNSGKVYSLAENECINAPDQIQTTCDLVQPQGSAQIDMYGNCVCISTGLPHVNGRCPTGANTTPGASPVSTVSQQQIEQKKQQIVKTYKNLTEITDGWGRSRWKTASGNFNGARLASDSVAGVVLGTVGGVVTSNIIKKNQVKGGFESLQCTVGGQMVADYGDQFQVGIR